MGVVIASRLCAWCNEKPSTTSFKQVVDGMIETSLSVCDDCREILAAQEKNRVAAIERKEAADKERRRTRAAERKASEAPESCRNDACSSCGGYGCHGCGETGCTMRCAACRKHTWRGARVAIDKAKKGKAA